MGILCHAVSNVMPSFAKISEPAIQMCVFLLRLEQTKEATEPSRAPAPAFSLSSEILHLLSRHDCSERGRTTRPARDL